MSEREPSNYARLKQELHRVAAHRDELEQANAKIGAMSERRATRLIASEDEIYRLRGCLRRAAAKIVRRRDEVRTMCIGAAQLTQDLKGAHRDAVAELAEARAALPNLYSYRAHSVADGIRRILDTRAKIREADQSEYERGAKETRAMAAAELRTKAQSLRELQQRKEQQGLRSDSARIGGRIAGLYEAADLLDGGGL